jgi:hypothetical protein
VGPTAPIRALTGGIPGAALDRDRRRVAAVSDGLAHLELEPADRVVGQQPLGDPLSRGLDEPELAVLDD